MLQRVRGLKGSTKETIIAAVFSMYLFIHMTVETLCTKNSTGVLTSGEQLAMYYVDQLFLVAGFILFALVWNRLGDDNIRAVFIKAISAIFFLLSFIIIIYQSRISFLILAPLATLFLGLFGGTLNFFMAVALIDAKNVGRILAASATAAFLLQFLTQILTDNRLLLLFFIMAFAVVTIAIVNEAWEWLLIDCVPTAIGKSDPGNNKANKNLITVLVISVISVLLLTYYDSNLIRLMVESGLQVSAFSWPRLFAILGYIIIGIVGDISKRKYVNVTMVLLILWLLISPVIFSENPGSNANMALFYTVIGALMCYMYLMFWGIAPYTGKGITIVPSIGRIIDGVAGVIFSLIPWGNMNVTLIIVLHIVCIILMLITMIINGDFLITNKDEDTSEKEKDVVADIKVPADIVSDDEVFAKMTELYSLTDRESEVLKKLLFTEESGQDIADSLYISRRVFQKHVASIYEKTGTKSRVGLYQKYHLIVLDLTKFRST